MKNPYIYKMQILHPEATLWLDSATYPGRYRKDQEQSAVNATTSCDWGGKYRLVLDTELAGKTNGKK